MLILTTPVEPLPEPAPATMPPTAPKCVRCGGERQVRYRVDGLVMTGPCPKCVLGREA